MNGKQALALVVQKQTGANSVEVSKTVRAELEEMREAPPVLPVANASYVENKKAAAR